MLVAEHPMREEAPWARRVMGQAYARQLKWPEAIAQLRMTLAMTPHDAEARRLLVDAYNSLGIESGAGAEIHRRDRSSSAARSAMTIAMRARATTSRPRCSMRAS